MSSRQLLIVAVVGIVGFVVYKKFMAPPPPLAGPAMNNPQSGHSASAGGNDLFSQILGAATSIAGAVSAVAQSGAKSQ